MLIPYLNGLWEGIIISLLLFGPAFFKLLNVSMQEGVFKGIWLATGVVLSDLLVVILLVYGLSDLFNNLIFRQIYSMLAGIAMIFIGLKSILNRYRAFLKSYKARNLGGQNLLRGFLLNLINPFTIVLWFNLLSAISLKYDDHANYKLSLILNVGGILTTIYLMDMLKVYFADIIGRKISQRMFYAVNRYFGVVFLIIGAFFIYLFLKLVLTKG
jgi:amino acid exporter